MFGVPSWATDPIASAVYFVPLTSLPEIAAPSDSAFDLVGWLLYFGVRYGTPEIVSILILHGIPIDQPGSGINYRITSLQRTVRRGSIEIVTLILDAGAQIDRTTEHSRVTPLYLACLYHREDIANLLIDRGARLDGGVLATAAYYDCGAIL